MNYNNLRKYCWNTVLGSWIAIGMIGMSETVRPTTSEYKEKVTLTEEISNIETSADIISKESKDLSDLLRAEILPMKERLAEIKDTPKSNYYLVEGIIAYTALGVLGLSTAMAIGLYFKRDDK